MRTRAVSGPAVSLPNGPWSHPLRAASPVSTPYGLDTASKQVQRSFGDGLAALKAAHLPYNVEGSMLLTYSESANPASPHYADQTELFSRRKWVTAYFCPDQVAAHAVSTTVLRGQ